MRRKQASPDHRKADEMGVSSYTPKNQKKDAHEPCVWMEWLGDEGHDVCGQTATHDVTLASSDNKRTDALCDRHAKQAQAEYIGTVTVRRRKL